MTSAAWAQRRPSETSAGCPELGDWAQRSAADVTMARRQLRAQLSGPGGRAAAADDVERLLLAFEELASNGVRHGRPPVRVRVLATSTGWLIDVSDDSVDAPPAPAVDRDPAHGGLGLHLIAELAASHGWFAEDGRKHVWAVVCRTAS